jgi:threonylcarbamoyladenosine tRNA methylthiotransferase CDKAL1
MVNVLVEVYGCSANVADAEIASGLLREAGYNIIDSLNDADAVVLMTCVVKTPTERKIIRRIQGISEKGIPLVVAGCMPKTLQGVVEEIDPYASLVGPDDLSRIPEGVAAALNQDKVTFLNGSSRERCLLPRMRQSNVIHIAPIATGCLGNCAYCIVKNARGRLHSFPAESIVEDAKRALNEGCREIWITAEDTACYESDGIQLPGLLNILSDLPGRFYIRVGMMTPNHALGLLDDLLESYSNPKVFKFLHIPVQSGSDKVLERMRRRYTSADFRETVTRFREVFPEASVSTDIICGFPGETEDEWRETMELIKWLRPDAMNISRFWSRPGTEATLMKPQLPGREIKRRSTELNELWRQLNYDTASRWVGWEGEILLDGAGHSGTMVGRNYAYKEIALETDVQPGNFVHVRATKAGQGFLTGVKTVSN